MDERERLAFSGDAAAQCAMGDDYFFEAFDADIEDKDDLYKKLFIGTAVRPRAVMPLANITWAISMSMAWGRSAT